MTPATLQRAPRTSWRPPADASMTGEQFLYLSREDVAAVAVDSDAARAAVIASFRALAEGRCTSLPKQPLTIGLGHAFQAMVAASAGQNIAAVKWLGITALDHGAALARIQAVICLNDYATGALLAVMDGDRVTLIRTAAMSAAAAEFLAPRSPASIGFIGCGAQAQAHLAAFRALYPQLGRHPRLQPHPRLRRGAGRASPRCRLAGSRHPIAGGRRAAERHPRHLRARRPWARAIPRPGLAEAGRLRGGRRRGPQLAGHEPGRVRRAGDGFDEPGGHAGRHRRQSRRTRLRLRPRSPRQRCRAAAWRPRVVQLQGVRDRRSRSGEPGLRSGPDPAA